MLLLFERREPKKSVYTSAVRVLTASFADIIPECVYFRFCYATRNFNDNLIRVAFSFFFLSRVKLNFETHHSTPKTENHTKRQESASNPIERPNQTDPNQPSKQTTNEPTKPAHSEKDFSETEHGAAKYHHRLDILKHGHQKGFTCILILYMIVIVIVIVTVTPSVCRCQCS